MMALLMMIILGGIFSFFISFIHWCDRLIEDSEGVES